MPKAAKEPKPRPKTFEDVFVPKPEHDHCKQVLASKRIRDCCFTGWDTSREAEGRRAPAWGSSRPRHNAPCEKRHANLEHSSVLTLAERKLKHLSLPLRLACRVASEDTQALTDARPHAQ